MFRYLRCSLVAACFLLGGLTVQSAMAATAQLRVEGGGVALDPGTRYVTSPVGIRKADADCDGAAGAFPIAGNTVMGLLGTGAGFRAGLRPLRATDSSGFGIEICRVSSFVKSSIPTFRGWAYRLNHVLPSTGADQTPIGNGDSVLWYFLDYGATFGDPNDGDLNTGDELVLRAPPRVRPGTFQVSVTGYPFSGGPHPAADGTAINGGDSSATTTGGLATVALNDPGFHWLKATNRPDIPSERVLVCVNANLRKCPRHRGARIVGSAGADRVKGTKGPDRVLGRGGNDRIRVRGRGRDRVNCGRGRDVVFASAGDRVASNCEVVHD